MKRPGVQEVRRVVGVPTATLALTMSKDGIARTRDADPAPEPDDLLSSEAPAQAAYTPDAETLASEAAATETLADEPAPEKPEPPPREPNAFTDGPWQTRLDAWAGLFVRVGLVVGAIFSVYQYLAQREEQRVAQTMQLVEMWDQGNYQEAQQAVKQRLTDLNAKYSNLLGPKPTQTEQSIYRQRIGIEAMSADGGAMPLPEFSAQFDRVVYFLNRLAFCVDGNLCSRKVADAYFRDYAISFWSYFAGYVEKQRKAGSPTYGLSIEKYVSEAPPSFPQI